MFIFTINQELQPHMLIGRIMSYDYSLDLKEFLNQINLLYVYICDRSRVMCMQVNGRIMGYDHFLDRKDIIKFVYVS
jgi:hypothetical protein